MILQPYQRQFLSRLLAGRSVLQQDTPTTDAPDVLLQKVRSDELYGKQGFTYVIHPHEETAYKDHLPPNYVTSHPIPMKVVGAMAYPARVERNLKKERRRSAKAKKYNEHRFNVKLRKAIKQYKAKNPDYAKFNIVGETAIEQLTSAFQGMAAAIAKVCAAGLMHMLNNHKRLRH